MQFECRSSGYGVPALAGKARGLDRATKQAEAWTPYLQILVVLLISAGAAGCSSFNRDWKRAGLEPQPTDGLTGRWEGFWMSDHNGHNGRLRCLITPSDAGHYWARYRAKYRKILAFGYTVRLKVQSSNETFRFQGEADLGKLAGGIYSYFGEVRGTNFHSSYRSKYDYGYFRMGRPQ